MFAEGLLQWFHPSRILRFMKATLLLFQPRNIISSGSMHTNAKVRWPYFLRRVKPILHMKLARLTTLTSSVYAQFPCQKQWEGFSLLISVSLTIAHGIPPSQQKQHHHHHTVVAIWFLTGRFLTFGLRNETNWAGRLTVRGVARHY